MAARAAAGSMAPVPMMARYTGWASLMHSGRKSASLSVTAEAEEPRSRWLGIRLQGKGRALLGGWVGG